MLIPKSLAPIAVAAATEATRFTMNGVHLTRLPNGRAQMTATDGRRVLRATWTDADAIQYPTMLAGGSPLDPAGKAEKRLDAIVPIPALLDALKAAAKSRHKPILAHAVLEESSVNGTVRLVATDMERVHDSKTRVLDGEYPDFSGVFPKRLKRLGCLNPRLLGEALIAMAKIMEAEGCELPSVYVDVADKDSKGNPWVFTGKAGSIELQAVVMPITTGEEK
jgi:DNA polymerase III sliding clamp (beta) subunit (PCNA family)